MHCRYGGCFAFVVAVSCQVVGSSVASLSPSPSPKGPGPGGTPGPPPDSGEDGNLNSILVTVLAGTAAFYGAILLVLGARRLKRIHKREKRPRLNDQLINKDDKFAGGTLPTESTSTMDTQLISSATIEIVKLNVSDTFSKLPAAGRGASNGDEALRRARTDIGHRMGDDDSSSDESSQGRGHTFGRRSHPNWGGTDLDEPRSLTSPLAVLPSELWVISTKRVQTLQGKYRLEHREKVDGLPIWKRPAAGGIQAAYIYSGNSRWLIGEHKGEAREKWLISSANPHRGLWPDAVYPWQGRVPAVEDSSIQVTRNPPQRHSGLVVGLPDDDDRSSSKEFGRLKSSMKTRKTPTKDKREVSFEVQAKKEKQPLGLKSPPARPIVTDEWSKTPTPSSGFVSPLLSPRASSSASPPSGFPIPIVSPRARKNGGLASPASPQEEDGVTFAAAKMHRKSLPGPHEDDEEEEHLRLSSGSHPRFGQKRGSPRSHDAARRVSLEPLGMRPGGVTPKGIISANLTAASTGLGAMPPTRKVGTGRGRGVLSPKASVHVM
eukprot:Hpha_TRINITY_DN5116_c0_g1::TRINITY_DN5116_c0_g1_i1::g.192924::m.192924